MEDEKYLNSSGIVIDPDFFSQEDLSFILLHIAKVNYIFHLLFLHIAKVN